MPSRLGPIEIRCEALPYPVVRACERLGFRSPLDVPWFHRPHYLETPNPALAAPAAGWMPWFGKGRRPCRCGLPLPVLEKYTFIFPPDLEMYYLLGQCPKCRSIFWEAA